MSEPFYKIFNGGIGSGRHKSLQVSDLKRYHLINYTDPDKPIHSVMARDRNHAIERLSAIHGITPQSGKQDVIPHEDLLGEKRLIKEQMNDKGYGLIMPYPTK